MQNELYICGDSFAAGCGLDHPETFCYGVEVADELGMVPVNIAKHAGSNYNIMCQVLYAVERKPGLIIIQSTTVDRFDWIARDCKLYQLPKATDFNYHAYYPFDKKNHPFAGVPSYRPIILSESMSTIAYAIDNFDTMRERGEEDYYLRRFASETRDSIIALKKYILDLYNYNLKFLADRSHILMAVRECERKKIPFVVVDSALDLDEFVEKRCLPKRVIDPIFYSGSYPDKQGTLHISEEGHRLVADLILEKL